MLVCECSGNHVVVSQPIDRTVEVLKFYMPQEVGEGLNTILVQKQPSETSFQKFFPNVIRRPGTLHIYFPDQEVEKKNEIGTSKEGFTGPLSFPTV